MDFRPTRARTIHVATHTVHGEMVQAFVHATPGHGGKPQAHDALARAHDVMADLHAGGERIKAGHVVEPVAFAEHELTHCPYTSDWLAAVVVGGEGVMVRVHCDNLDHARVKLGTMVAHLHAGDTHAKAVVRVAARPKAPDAVPDAP